jgi:hypothetical protein
MCHAPLVSSVRPQPQLQASSDHQCNSIPYIFIMVALGGLVIACLPLDPRFAGSKPAGDDGFLSVIKIRSTSSFGGEVQSSVPCRHVKEPYEHETDAL